MAEAVQALLVGSQAESEATSRATQLAANDRTAKFEERGDLRELAARLVKRYPGRLGSVVPTQIAFLMNTEDKPVYRGCRVWAKCVRLPARIEFLCDYTHVIEFYRENIGHLTNRQLTVLLYHELLHIGEEGKPQAHDVEEFGEILDTFGRGVLETTRDDMPDILDGVFEWRRVRPPGLFDQAESSPARAATPA